MTPEALLAFEQHWPRHTPDKDITIRRELDITPARFYQLLGRAAATVEGMSADPITARRVRERQPRVRAFGRWDTPGDTPGTFAAGTKKPLH